jgi:EPS-associated MarR family transcriptional regulator
MIATDARTDETHFKLMRLIAANPEVSQRDAARELGMSLGKVNYCIRALVARGWVKVDNFKNSRRKAAYAYLLTPRGIEAKARMAVLFLKIKAHEYESLSVEVEQFQRSKGAGRAGSVGDD